MRIEAGVESRLESRSESRSESRLRQTSGVKLKIKECRLECEIVSGSQSLPSGCIVEE